MNDLISTIKNIIDIEKLNFWAKDFIMPAMAIAFFLFSTVINLWLDGRVETIQNVLAAILIFVVLFNIVFNEKIIFNEWIKDNIFVIVYFCFRILSVLSNGVDYSAIRCVFFEAFYLIGIMGSVTCGKSNGHLYIKLFIIFQGVFSLLSIVMHSLIPYLNSNYYKFLYDFTYLKSNGNSMLFSNPNSAGIMAGFAVLLVFIIYNKKIFSNKFLVVYGLFNLIALYMFDCRSSYMGLIVAILCFLAVKIKKNIDKKNFVLLVFIVFTLSVVPIYGFIEYQTTETQNYYSMNKIEEKVNSISTNRYVIWKECYLLQKDKPLFGYGSLRLENDARRNLMESIDLQHYKADEKNEVLLFIDSSKFGPHNGYLSMVSGAGILGMVMFSISIIKRIQKSKLVNIGNWFLILVFIFTINCFESIFILNRLFIILYMFLMLEDCFMEIEEKEI